MDPEQIRLKKTDVATTLARLWGKPEGGVQHAATIKPGAIRPAASSAGPSRLVGSIWAGTG
eukprot:scaffold52159_cov264-Isochrysis_galbana.AAC.1